MTARSSGIGSPAGATPKLGQPPARPMPGVAPPLEQLDPLDRQDRPEDPLVARLPEDPGVIPIAG